MVDRRKKRNRLLRRGGVRKLRDYFDERYQEKDIRNSLSTGNTIGIISNSRQQSSLKNVPYVTVGNQRIDLPNSQPIGGIGSNVSPSVSFKYSLGWFNRIWNNIITGKLTIRKTNSGPQASYDYETWFTAVAHKIASVKLVIDGYGGEKAYSSNIEGSIKISRAAFGVNVSGQPITWDADKTYTQLKNWSVKGWWSPTDLSNTTGIGIMRDCSDDASPFNPGVEFEIEDTGNDEYVFARFRNFYSQRVVVGLRIVA